MFEFLKNEIDFFIRNKTKFSRGNFVEKSSRIIEFVKKENSYIYAVLDKFFKKQNLNKTKILDIGSKNWSYADAQYRFFSSFCDEFYLDGVEVDAYRLYSNFYSRYDAAKFYIKNLKNVNYICGNVLDINKKYNYITWFLPFISEYPLKKWGLPKRFYQPEKLLLHAYDLLDDDGQMLVVNQGEKEALIQKELLEKLKIPYDFLGEIINDKSLYPQQRYGYLIHNCSE